MDKVFSKSYIICIEKCDILEVRQIKFLDMSNPGSANGLLPDNTASQQWVDITSGNDLSIDSTEPAVSYIIMSFGPIVPWQWTIDNMIMKWICIHHMDTFHKWKSSAMPSVTRAALYWNNLSHLDQ